MNRAPTIADTEHIETEAAHLIQDTKSYESSIWTRPN